MAVLGLPIFVLKHVAASTVENAWTAIVQGCSVTLGVHSFSGCLETKHGDSFSGLYADVKGDVLMSQGKRQEARAAYQVALDKSDAASPLRQIVQLKIDAVGESK